ncbi:C4-dicarboxylate ABC transporter [Rhodococcus sp. ACPA4]|uniref:YfcC family protein n=1 Tax=Rhodococcus TaxID=1827 RepID=UPI000BB0DD83|nr:MULTISPECIES: YfcC family protein [Rhodococcus]MDV8065669.1 YfcC family protein [Rhodococcus sp. IEGM 1366]PBC43808.1 C4-dicarboxylate ABC transporter [Rhodococcus sp. ACPA4]QXW00695.1 YfcC family protein [Rhodococcus globerulus]RZL26657.1 MAG: YfcC family protein [Rhodococcus sp. (in: high G+C Gram-positive bacteria)]
MSTKTEEGAAHTPAKKKFEFPGAVTMLAIVTVLVWIAALFIPAGRFGVDVDGSPVPGSFETVTSPLTFFERIQQLILSPVNGLYGVQDPLTGFVDTDNIGRLFGSVGVVLFIMALGAFISVSFATRSLETAVSQLATKLSDKGWLLITVIMVLFSLLGSTMGFSVETFGFYALLIPLMTALGYDRMVAATMIILGALVGNMASTVNPFSIGVASGEAGVSIGDGIVLRVILWIVLTAVAVVFVLRYAAKVKKDPATSLVGFDIDDEEEEAAPPVDIDSKLTGIQKLVLVITGLTFGLMIFSVIPWSSIFGGTTGPAEYDAYHVTATEPYWFELNWWFPQLAMLFILAAVLVGIVAKMGEKKTVSLITRGAGDMVGPAIVILLARGVSVIMTNTETLDTILNAMEQLVSGASAGVFAILVMLVNIPLAFLIPSSSGHATLAMPLLAPLGDFAGVSRSLVITAFQMGHGLMLMVAPTNVVVVGGLAMAKVGYDKFLRFVWPLLLINFVIVVVVIGAAAVLE